MSMIDFPKIDSQGFFHDWNGFAMDRFNDPHLPSAGFTRRGVKAARNALDVDDGSLHLCEPDIAAAGERGKPRMLQTPRRSVHP